MRALQLHYDGPDEARKRLSVAKAQLEKLLMILIVLLQELLMVCIMHNVREDINFH